MTDHDRLMREMMIETLVERIMKLGPHHPGVAAIQARMNVAYGRRPTFQLAVIDHDTWCILAHAYTTAQLRAYGAGMNDNRRQRRFVRERVAKAQRHWTGRTTFHVHEVG